MDALKKFSPALFGVIIICFFLPFVSITCGGQTVMSLTGFQLITGAEYKPSGMFGDNEIFNENGGAMPQEKQDVESQPLALLAFIAALAAFGLSFIRKKTSAFICMIISAAGGILLLLLKANLDGESVPEAQGIIELNYQFGYWFAFLLFIAGAVVHWFMFKKEAGKIIINEVPPVSMQD